MSDNVTPDPETEAGKGKAANKLDIDGIRRGMGCTNSFLITLLIAAALAVRLTVPPIRPVEDSLLQVGTPCRAHQ